MRETVNETDLGRKTKRPWEEESMGKTKQETKRKQVLTALFRSIRSLRPKASREVPGKRGEEGKY